MSDFIKIPYADAMLLKIPTHIDPIHLASLSDNVPDAYRHVESLEENKEQSILIIGGMAKSVGLYTALLAKALGAKEIVYVDDDKERLTIAKNIGGDKTIESVSTIKGKYAIVVDANSTKEGLDAAIRAVRNYGTVSSSGIYMKKTVMPLMEMYGNGITFKTGLANARTDAEKILNLLKHKEIDFSLITTKLADWENSIDAFLSDTAKVIVKRERINKP